MSQGLQIHLHHIPEFSIKSESIFPKNTNENVLKEMVNGMRSSLTFRIISYVLILHDRWIEESMVIVSVLKFMVIQRNDIFKDTLVEN